MLVVFCKTLATPIYTLKLGLLVDYDLLQPYLKQENYYIYNNFKKETDSRRIFRRRFLIQSGPLQLLSGRLSMPR
jgi:hypothetical protein